MTSVVTHSLRILHISDLHERVALDWMPDDRKAKVKLGAPSRYRVLGPSFERLLGEIASERSPDLVCFTGDVADWGLAEEYELAARRIDGILACLNVAADRLFIVPGNHDVDRSRAEHAWRGIRELSSEGTDMVERIGNWLGGLPPPPGADASWLQDVLQRTAAFWQWVTNRMGRGELAPVHSRHGVLGYSLTRPPGVLPFPIHVIGLDSAWLAGDNHDAKKLLVTRQQIQQLCTDGVKPLDGFRLALVHHPVEEWLDAHACRGELLERIDLLLHGHQHVPSALDNVQPDGVLRALAAGSMYEWDAGDRYLNSFHVIDVTCDPRGLPLHYDVTFWGWSPRGRGYWHKTGAIYEEAVEGHLSWPVHPIPGYATDSSHASSLARRTHKVDVGTPLTSDLLSPSAEDRSAPSLSRANAPDSASVYHAASNTASSYESSRTLFIGREEELSRLREHIGRPVFVYGQHGFGKTSLVLEHASRHATSAASIHYVNFQHLSAGDGSFADRFLPSSPSDKDLVTKIHDQLLALYKTAANDFIIFDEVEAILHHSSEVGVIHALRPFVYFRHGQHVREVATATPSIIIITRSHWPQIESEIVPDSPMLHKLYHYHLMPLGMADCRALIEGLPDTSVASMTEADRQALSYLSGGIPLLIEKWARDTRISPGHGVQLTGENLYVKWIGSSAWYFRLTWSRLSVDERVAVVSAMLFRLTGENIDRHSVAHLRSYAELLGATSAGFCWWILCNRNVFSGTKGRTEDQLLATRFDSMATTFTSISQLLDRWSRYPN